MNVGIQNLSFSGLVKLHGSLRNDELSIDPDDIQYTRESWDEKNLPKALEVHFKPHGSQTEGKRLDIEVGTGKKEHGPPTFTELYEKLNIKG